MDSPNLKQESQKESTVETQSWFSRLIDLEKGVDRPGTVSTIKNNKRMEGANAWLLMCSIMIASLGLDLDSPAVLIGAMLISPLMSPILGIGLAVAINDREALFLSLRHFGLSIAIALITSTLYFYITPLGGINEQIVSRTKPTFLDGLVAVFGGLAGIISTTRKDQSNAIPGVAIATALMPPLCVTGYGIANGNWEFMINSFYLFFLNSFFIALTAYLIIKLLDFPLKKYENPREARRTRTYLILFSLLIILPSFRILLKLYKERQDDRKIAYFVERHFSIDQPTYCNEFELIEKDTSRQLLLELWGETVNKDSLQEYERTLDSLGLGDVKLALIQDSDAGLKEISRLQKKLNNLEQVNDKLDLAQKVSSVQDQMIEKLQSQLDSVRNHYLSSEQIFKETKTVFPDLKSIASAEVEKTSFDSTVYQMPVYIISWQRNKSTSTKRKDQRKMYDFLKLRAELDTLQIIVE